MNYTDSCSPILLISAAKPYPLKTPNSVDANISAIRVSSMPPTSCRVNTSRGIIDFEFTLDEVIRVETGKSRKQAQSPIF
jgi:hypothetical protein